MDKMAAAIKNAYLYKFEPTPPSRKAMEIRRLIEYSKITDFKKRIKFNPSFHLHRIYNRR